MSVVAMSDREWIGLTRALGRPEWLEAALSTADIAALHDAGVVA